MGAERMTVVVEGIELNLVIVDLGCGASWDWRGGTPAEQPEWTIQPGEDGADDEGELLNVMGSEEAMNRAIDEAVAEQLTERANERRG